MADTNRRLSGKVILVTGVASGIGATSLRLFAEQGARVAGLDIRPESEVEAVGAIRQAGGEVLYQRADVTSEAEVERAVQAVVDRFGRLDGVFNVVGAVSRAAALDCSVDELDRMLAINLRSVFLVSKSAIGRMRDNPNGGSIVSMSSNVAVIGLRRNAAYSAAKGGVSGLTRQMAADYGWDKIRINCLAPGPVEDTGIFQSRTDPDADRRKFVEGIPLCKAFGRLIGTRDIANAAAFLLSDEAVMISGVTLVIDGAQFPQ